MAKQFIFITLIFVCFFPIVRLFGEDIDNRKIDYQHTQYGFSLQLPTNERKMLSNFQKANTRNCLNGIRKIKNLDLIEFRKFVIIYAGHYSLHKKFLDVDSSSSIRDKLVILFEFYFKVPSANLTRLTHDKNGDLVINDSPWFSSGSANFPVLLIMDKLKDKYGFRFKSKNGE